METGWRPQNGRIEVICGSMFSGKTEELIRRLRRSQIAKQKVVVFKPKIDNRFHKEKIVSHSKQEIHSIVIRDAEEILQHAVFSQVIGIDEAQFFDNRLIDMVQDLADCGKRVIIAGLDMDYRGIPFEPMPYLLAIAEDITKMHAICMRCGAPANYTQRISTSKERVVVGAGEIYEARCRHCFEAPEARDVYGDDGHPSR
ncbi:MAG: thymidine kinase [Candidatus Marinimicrobia bacterium]|nr:thymidine kinase [Candidatus Neomarinimicrobiota bacterium]